MAGVEALRAPSMTAVSRRGLLLGGASLAAAGALQTTAPWSTSTSASPGSRKRAPISAARIRRWADDTWACLVAMTDEKTGLTADNLDGLDHHRASGMDDNWYDEVTGEVLTTWPESGDLVVPFLSSVDNGWLAAAFMLVEEADPANRKLAKKPGTG